MKYRAKGLSLLLIFYILTGFNIKQEGEKPEFVYVYDPLCGWCYGFSSVIQEIKAKYDHKADFTIYSGGLVTGEKVMSIGDLYKGMEGSFETLEDRTGAEFGEPYMELVREGSYQYDSEPPAIALAVVKDLKPEVAFDYAAKLHSTLFSEGKSLNDTSTYKDLAQDFGMDEDEFLTRFQDTAYINKARADFKLVEENSISGFPFLMLKKDGEYHIIADGYVNFKKADRRIRKALK